MRPTSLLPKHLLRTVINPKNHTLSATVTSLLFKPKSLFCLANSRNISKAIQDILSLQKTHPEIGIIAAAVDTVHQDSITEAWFDEEIQLTRERALNIENEIKRRTKLRVGIHPKTQFELPLVDTVGFTNFSHTLFYKIGNHSFSEMMAELEIILPLQAANEKTFSALKPIGEEWNDITLFRDNVVSEISNQSASSILMNALQRYKTDLDSIEKIYVEIKSTRMGTNKYEVIAGGGEYGPRSAKLVFDCPSLPHDEKVQCRFLVSDKVERVEAVESGITVEQINDENRINFEGEDIIKDGFIRLGDGDGFVYKGQNFRAKNCMVNIQVVDRPTSENST